MGTVRSRQGSTQQSHKSFHAAVRYAQILITPNHYLRRPCADIARSGYALVGQFPVYQPRTFMHSASFIAMGHAFPAALGAKVAFPHRQVVSVSGDGCFLMTGQEMATAVQHGINVVAIVINDRCLTGIAALQDSHYNGRRIAVDLVNPDFVRLAESFGALGLRVANAAEFKPALEEALRAGKPALISVDTP